MSIDNVWDKVWGKGSDLEEQYDKIYRYCFFKVKNRELAEDITQEVFLRFLNQEDCRSIERKLPYLYTIARNLCIDEYRKRKSLPLIEEEWVEDAGTEEKMFSSISLKMALAALEEDEREMILLRYVNETPFAVICKIFGFSRYTVYRKLQKALKKLEEELREN